MSHSHETVHKSVRFGWRTDLPTYVLYGASLTHVGRSLIHVGRSLTHVGRSLTHVGRLLTHVGRSLTYIGRSLTRWSFSSVHNFALSSWCLSGILNTSVVVLVCRRFLRY